MSNEIQIYQKFTDPLVAIERLGAMFAKSGMVNAEKTEQGQVLAWACLSEQKSPFEIMRTFHIVGGRLTKKGMAIYADFLTAGGKLKWLKTGEESVANNDERCASAEITYGGQTITFSYSIADCKREGLWDRKGSRYQTSPGEMLRSKVQTKGIPILAPGLVAGGDDGEESIPVATLDLAKPAVAQTVVDVSDDEKELAKTGLAPVQPAAPAAAVSNPAPPLTGFTPLDDATVTKICAHMGMENMPKVTDWLVANFWINSAGDLSSMPIAKANQLLRTEKSKCFKNFQITPA